MDTEAQGLDAATPMPGRRRFLRGIARVAFNRLVETHPELRPRLAQPGFDAECWIDRAARVLATNIASGRLEAARGYQPAGLDADATLLSYATQVLVELLTEFERLDQLKRGDSAAWRAVIENLERIAYHWFGPSGREEWAGWEAREVTARTCADLWIWLQEHPYPFDIPFDRWAIRALHNRLFETRRQQRIRDRHVVGSLDQPLFQAEDGKAYGDVVADTSFDLWLDRAANRQALLQALDQLETQQARVIRLWYLEQWPADEIAAAIGRRVDYVYLQRCRGIEKLRKIALQDERLGLAEVLHAIEHEGRRSRLTGQVCSREEDTPS